MVTDDLMRAQMEFGHAMRVFDSDRELAIELLLSVANVFARYPHLIADWGQTQYELGLAFGSRTAGERAENLRTAIAHYVRASGAFPLETDADRHAMVRQNLGSTLSDLVDLEPLEPGHTVAAIRASREAMDAHAYRRNPVDWASAANNLAIACRDALHGPRAAQIEEAIDLHEAALGVFTAGALSIEAAMRLRRDGNAHWSDERVRLAPSTRTSLQQGQERYTYTDFRRDRAWTLAHLGISITARIRGERAQNLEAGIDASVSALRAFEELNDTRGQARVANNIGHAYSERILGGIRQPAEQREALSLRARAPPPVAQLAFRDRADRTEPRRDSALGR